MVLPTLALALHPARRAEPHVRPTSSRRWSRRLLRAQLGTVDSVVYDTVLEETGSSERYEHWIGRIRMVESGAFVVSALAGGRLGEYALRPAH